MCATPRVCQHGVAAIVQQKGAYGGGTHLQKQAFATTLSPPCYLTRAYHGRHSGKHTTFQSHSGKHTTFQSHSGKHTTFQSHHPECRVGK